MAFEVIPFCRIVKFSGITRFLYQFWKILPKYCGRKEKDHNILWSKWYSRRESNPQRPLRRGLLYPFNYGSISCYPAGNNSSLRSSCHRKRWGEPEMIFPASMQKHILLSRLGILRRCAPRATASGGPFKRRRSPQNREPFERPLFYNVSRKKATVFEGEV